LPALETHKHKRIELVVVFVLFLVVPATGLNSRGIAQEAATASGKSPSDIKENSFETKSMTPTAKGIFN